jgi:hypothetical protein
MELTKLLNGQMSEIGNNFETKHFEGEITKLKRWIGIDNHSRLHNWTRIYFRLQYWKSKGHNTKTTSTSMTDDLGRFLHRIFFCFKIGGGKL